MSVSLIAKVQMSSKNGRRLFSSHLYMRAASADKGGCGLLDRAGIHSQTRSAGSVGRRALGPKLPNAKAAASCLMGLKSTRYKSPVHELTGSARRSLRSVKASSTRKNRLAFVGRGDRIRRYPCMRNKYLIFYDSPVILASQSPTL